MELIQTALGRWVPSHESQTVLEDGILRVLFDYRMSPQNPENVPMKLSDIVRAVNSDERLVLAALEALKTDTFVENRGLFQQERTFGITGLGVRFIRNMPQDNFG